MDWKIVIADSSYTELYGTYTDAVAVLNYAPLHFSLPDFYFEKKLLMLEAVGDYDIDDIINTTGVAATREETE